MEITKENEKQNEIQEKKRKQLWNYPLCRIMALAVGMTLYMEIWNQKSLGGLWNFIGNRPVAFGINLLIVLATLVPGFLFRRRIFYVTFMSLVWIIGGTVNGVILTQRITPFTINDFDVVQTGLGVLPNYFSNTELYAMAGGIIATVVILVIVFCKAPKVEKRSLWKGALITAICVAAALGGTEAALRQGELSNVFNNLGDAYQKYGFAYCFGSTWLNRGVTRPSNYSQERMLGVLDNIEEERDWDSEAPNRLPNIVYVQLESFMDPQYIKWLECSEDPLPNWRRIKRRGSDGFLTVPVVGAGTSNTEMEILTGMRIRFFGPGEYPFETILKKTTVETTAYSLKELGYATHALHNHRGVFYGRNEIYANLGFDDFTSLEYMLNVTKTPKNWARDEVLTDEIMTALQSTEGRDYVYTVSVQGHGKYPTKKVYDEPEIQIQSNDPTVSQERLNQFEYYVQQVHEMDQFIGELTDALSRWDEPTVVVFYGDHLPNLDIEKNELTNRDLFQTEYVVWSNFRMRQKDQDLYAYQLSAELFDQLGIHAGTMIQFHQTQQERTSYISNLKALQYDMLYGQRYIYGEKGMPKPTDLKMGIRDIVVTNVFSSAGKWYVQGENFTPYSEVTVDGEILDTDYISENLLLVNGVMTLPDASQIQISQVEKYRVVLSVSPETLPEEEP